MHKTDVSLTPVAHYSNINEILSHVPLGHVWHAYCAIPMTQQMAALHKKGANKQRAYEQRQQTEGKQT